MPHAVRIWDLPTRLFHWVLVACVAALVVTGHLGGAFMPWHARAGYAVLTLVLFRLAWGFVGGHWSRFASFVAGPARIAAYVRGPLHVDGAPGHNPLGALFVLAIVALLLAQVATGLVADDEIAFTGPLNRFVTNAQALAATWYHRHVGQWAILGLVALHLMAVLLHQWHWRDDLIGPMVTGDKAVRGDAERSRDDAHTRALALAVLLGCTAVVAWVVRLGA